MDNKRKCLNVSNPHHITAVSPSKKQHKLFSFPNTIPIETNFHTYSLDETEDTEIIKSKNELERIYEEKLQNLNTWYLNEVKKIQETQVNIKRHTPCKSQFYVKYGKSACSAISLASIYEFFQSSQKNFLKLNWAQNVEFGAVTWKQWKEKHPFSTHNFISINELLNFEVLACIKRKMEKEEKEVIGHLEKKKLKNFEKPVNPNVHPKNSKSYFKTLEDLANSLNTTDRKGKKAATLTLRSETISIFKDGMEYWIFNSHGGYKEGLSLLIQCGNKENFIMCLKECFPIRPYSNFHLNPYADNGQPYDPNVFEAIIFNAK